MPAGERGEIARAHQRAPRDKAEIARKLRPECRLQPHILAHRHHAKIGERSLHLGNPRIHLVLIAAPHHDRQMVFAKGS